MTLFRLENCRFSKPCSVLVQKQILNTQRRYSIFFFGSKSDSFEIIQFLDRANVKMNYFRIFIVYFVLLREGIIVIQINYSERKYELLLLYSCFVRFLIGVCDVNDNNI